MASLAACSRRSPSSSPEVWTAKDLGLGRAVAVNAHTQVVLVDPTGASFVVAPDGSQAALGLFRAGESTVGTAIDDAGNVVGYNEGANGRTAVAYKGGTWATLPGIGGMWSAAISLGSPNLIAGVQGTDDVGGMQAFVLAGDAPVSLPLDAGHNSAAYLVGAGGAIAGIFETPSGDTHAFVVRNGTMNDLGTLGGADSTPYGMNSHGDVVGLAQAADGSGHAFVAPIKGGGNAMVDLGIPQGAGSAEARGIDDSGRVAGNVYSAGGLSQAVVFHRNEQGNADGTVVDMTPVDADKQPYVSAHVTAMAANGFIVGWGVQQDGTTHGVLWAPGSQ